MSDRILSSSELTIDLGRVRQNYRIVLARLGGVPAAAMVKANGYGLGATEMAQALMLEGCNEFFVAQLGEGIALRQSLEPGPVIHVLNGATPGTERDLIDHKLVPVLNSLEQIGLWRKASGNEERTATLHLDTGMSRLGLPPDEAARLLEDPSVIDGVRVGHVMSHLASADVADSPQSAEQLHRFSELRRHFPQGTASLANSSGVFLGSEYHFDLARPGIALYGGNPTPWAANPMHPVATLEAPILQVRSVDTGEVIGYGGTHTMTRPGRIATISIGYADGFLRSGSGTGVVNINGFSVPIVGRISMDLITLDVTDVPENLLALGSPVELIGKHCLIDDVAERAGSIANELLTDLGRRYQVQYTDSLG